MRFEPVNQEKVPVDLRTAEVADTAFRRPIQMHLGQPPQSPRLRRMPARHTPPLLLHRCHQVGIFLAWLVLPRLDFQASDALQVNFIRAVGEA